MPRTGGGTGPFVLNPVYLAVPGTTILATQHNTPLEDIEDTFNIPQPIAYGGTQGSTPIEAMDNLFIVGGDKASSASVDLDNVTGSFVNITGTTPITSIALSQGAIRFARAVSALPITASASLIVNGSTTASYTCEAGDQMMIVGYAAAIVRVWVQGRNKFLGSQFNIADATDQTKTARFLPGGPTATQRDYDLPYYSGTLGLVSDIRGYVFGLSLTTNALDTSNDIDIAAGSAVDSTGVVSMLLAAALGKRIDAAWAVGGTPAVPVGGLDTGAVGNNTYYIWLIRRPDTGVVDALFSLSASAPTMPANYTQKALIGILTRTAGVNSSPYLLDGNPQSGSVVDSRIATYATYTALATNIPNDDTIPQIGEGTEILSISYVPKSTTNKLRCTFEGWGGGDANNTLIGAMFVNGAANAVCAAGASNSAAGVFGPLSTLVHEFTPASTAAQTIAIRVGPSTGNMYLNGPSTGRRYGGVGKATLLIEEIKA